MLKRFSKYLFQSMVGMVGISVYILADTFFISVYSGADGLAVLNIILPVFGFIYAIGSMIGIGSATRYGICRAAGENAEHYFAHSIMWSLVCSILFVCIGLFAPGRFLGLLGADEELTRLGIGYIRIILLAAPLFMTYYTFTAFARNDNAAVIAMIGSIAGSMFNIIFDYVFMFVMNLGFTGAAMATAFCPAVTMLLCCIHYMSPKSKVRFRPCRLSLRMLISCIQLGVSAFVGEISSAVTTIVFNMLILGIAGNTGIAAYGIIANISIVAMSILNGLAQGAQPMISESYGKSDSAAVVRLLRFSLYVCIAIEILIVAPAWCMTDTLISIFNSAGDAELMRYAHTGMRLYFLGFIPGGINILLIAYFSAVDNARPAIVGSLLRGAIAIAACAVVMSALMGMNGIWLSFMAAELVTFAVIILMSRAPKK